MFGRATIRLGIGPHSSLKCNYGHVDVVDFFKAKIYTVQSDYTKYYFIEEY